MFFKKNCNFFFTISFCLTFVSLFFFFSLKLETPAQTQEETQREKAKRTEHSASSEEEKKQEKKVDLEDLLKRIKKEGGEWSTENLKREREFKAKRDQQQELLKQAQANLKRHKGISQNLIKEFEENEKVLQKLEQEFNISKGTLGELFGVFKQVAGDLRSQLDLSIVSAEISGRAEALSQRIKSHRIPSIQDLEFVWYELQREMTESGKVVQFESHLVNMKGERKKANITRLGSFNLVSNGLYLTYQPSTQQVVELSRQPRRKWTKLVPRLERADENQRMSFGVDPSRGALLSALIQSPSFSERIHQGGMIGYLILLLLFIGLGFAVERLIVLKKEEHKVIQQRDFDEKIHLDNSLGRLMRVFEENKEESLESLEVKIEEEVFRNRPLLERGIGTIKILATVAPLLGLLGTVTGMILTFQSITLFGTGDPKLMAGGISQALVTTVLGLTCAIPLILLHNFISNLSQKIFQILEEEGLKKIAYRK